MSCEERTIRGNVNAISRQSVDENCGSRSFCGFGDETYAQRKQPIEGMEAILTWLIDSMLTRVVREMY